MISPGIGTVHVPTDVVILLQVPAHPRSARLDSSIHRAAFAENFASASVIGVPLVYVFIGKSTLIVTAALVLLAALGDLMPPPSLLCAYSAQIVEEKNHFRILKVCLIPIALSMAIAIVILIFAQQISNILL